MKVLGQEKRQKRHPSWVCRKRTLTLGQQTRVMGILNVTPDSFSDGGRFFDPMVAVDRALEMVDQGADIIDIGGESTRPGAQPVSVADEINRTAPIIEKIREHSNVLISIDTTKAEVARQALGAGAEIINDVSALESDPEMVNVVATSGAGIVLMHMQGSPQTMQRAPSYQNVVDEVGLYLQTRTHFAMHHGVAREQIVIDPGIGFGKTTDHNLALLREFPPQEGDNFPILIGASRKRFIGELTGRIAPEERRAGSLGVAAWAALHGAHILRVHDVIDTCDVCHMLDTLISGDH